MKFYTLILTIIFLFLLPFTTRAGNDPIVEYDSTKEAELIRKMSDFIIESGKIVSKLDSSTFINLPVGFSAGTDGKYTLLITDAVLKPGIAYFTACLSIINPYDGTPLAFQASNIGFSYKGGLVGDIRLELVTDCKIPVCQDVNLTLMKGTYVQWDCNGFKIMKIKGNVGFSSNTFLPANADGSLKKDGKQLQAQVETEIKDLNDLSLTLSIDPFQIKGVPLTFACKNLAIDYSDFSNPEAVKFPAGYTGLPQGAPNLWRGIYIGEASIILDPKFKNKTSGKSPSFAAKDLIIDRNGLTGTLAANDLLAISDGDISGWNFSIKDFSVSLMTNKIVKAGFNGEMHIPVMKKGENLSYSALMDVEGKYSFRVNPKSAMNFDLFGDSKLTIKPNSSITIEENNGHFVPTAILSGNMSIRSSYSEEDSTGGMELAMVNFEEMRLSTEDPVFNVKYFALSGSNQGALGKFPIVIEKLALETNTTEANLSIGLALNLMGDSTEGFSGKTTVTLLSSRKGLEFKYKGFRIDEIRVHAAKPGAYEIDGGIAMARNDPDYGNGFRGDLHAKFGSDIDVTASAMFGNVNGLRYFYVDAMLMLSEGLPAGPLVFYGFGGGLYYHMKQQASGGSSFGKSRSGIVYKPDPQIGIGLMAEVKFGLATKLLVDADAKFEIVFNSNGGLNRIGFDGNAKCIVPDVSLVSDKFAAGIQKLANNDELEFSPTDAALSLSLNMNMDFQSHAFDAKMEAFVNVGSILKGVGDRGSAGRCVMHIGQDKWYIHIGTPQNPLGLSSMGFFKTNSFFMVGSDVPTQIPINDRVASILKIPQKTSSENSEAIETGKGLAFGTSFGINTGDLEQMPFYARFEMGAGCNILLVNQGKDCYCQGHPAPLGINGWYAKGQAYAYLDGEIGIKIDFRFIHKKIQIFGISAAALLIAEGPNPLYLEGVAGGHFSVLGGLVEGECRFDVSYGEKCQLMKLKKTSPIQDMQMIATLTPTDGQTDVDLFVSPQAVFNVPVNKVMNMSDDKNVTHRFRANLEKCELTQDGKTIAASQEWNAEKTVLALKFNEILNPDSKYSFTTVLSFEESNGGNWQAVMDNGAKLTEQKTFTFTTGKLPKNIPSSCISYSYPMARQYNFYPKEYPEGYIAFNIGLGAFFNPVDGWSKQARFTAIEGGTPRTSILKYDAGTRTVSFPIPTDLALDKIYKLELVNVPTSSDITRNVTEKTSTTELGNSSSVSVRTRSASGSISKAEENSFYSYGFRASKFNSLKDKLSMTEMTFNMLYEISPYDYFLQTKFEGTEMFDKFEIYGVANQPMIKRTAVLDESTWYKKELEPVVYQDYPLMGEATIDWRSTNELGVPPVGQIMIWQENYNHILTDDELKTGKANSIANEALLMYTLPYYWSGDYYNIRNKLANLVTKQKTNDERVKKILGKVIWPVVSLGDYPVKFEYILPGINKVSSTKVIHIKNPFEFVQPSL